MRVAGPLYPPTCKTCGLEAEPQAIGAIRACAPGGDFAELLGSFRKGFDVLFGLKFLGEFMEMHADKKHEKMNREEIVQRTVPGI